MHTFMCHIGIKTWHHCLRPSHLCEFKFFSLFCITLLGSGLKDGGRSCRWYKIAIKAMNVEWFEITIRRVKCARQYNEISRRSRKGVGRMEAMRGRKAKSWHSMAIGYCSLFSCPVVLLLLSKQHCSESNSLLPRDNFMNNIQSWLNCFENGKASAETERTLEKYLS
jgi:hypothetical protein